MERDAKNKIIVVTGGAEGIGYKIVESFLKAEAKYVILVDINETKGIDAANKLNEIYGKDKVEFFKADVTQDLEAVSFKILEKYTKVDCLVNNAGICDEFSPRKVIEINTTALIEWTYKFFEHMRKDKSGNGGTVINLGSIYSYFVDPYIAAYKASKFAVLGFSRTLGHKENYERYGVRVLVLCPGFTSTNMATPSLWDKFVWKEQADVMAEHSKTFTWQSAEDVGQAALKVFRTADSGTAWTITGGAIEPVP